MNHVRVITAHSMTSATARWRFVASDATRPSSIVIRVASSTLAR